MCGSVLILAKKVHLQYCRDVIRGGCFSLICLQDKVELNQNEVGCCAMFCSEILNLIFRVLMQLSLKAGSGFPLAIMST